MSDSPHAFPPEMRAVLFAPERIALLPREAIVEFAQIQPGMHVADLGCGNGYLLEALSTAAGPSGKIHASDTQEVMLLDAIALVRERSLRNVVLSLAGEFAIPEAPGSIDRAILCQVWHHIGDHAAYLHELDRVLKPDGEVVIVNWEPIETGIGPSLERRWAMDRTIATLAAHGWETLRSSTITWANYAVAAARSR